MPIEDDDRPRKKISHEIGQDLSLLSVEELTERIALLTGEITRFTLRTAGDTYRCFTPLLGRPIILNLAGAFTLASAVGIDPANRDSSGSQAVDDLSRAEAQQRSQDWLPAGLCE